MALDYLSSDSAIMVRIFNEVTLSRRKYAFCYRSRSYGLRRSSLIMGVHPGCPVCSIVASSLVAVETDVGEKNSAKKAAFVCGLWSVGVVALLSAGPFSYFCIHQLLFPWLEVLVQSASPPHAVGCKVLPGLGVHVKCFHVSCTHPCSAAVGSLWFSFQKPTLHKECLLGCGHSSMR